MQKTPSTISNISKMIAVHLMRMEDCLWVWAALHPWHVSYWQIWFAINALYEVIGTLRTAARPFEKATCA